MNEEYLIKGETLSDIADAIREKDGTQSPIQVSNFATSISNIPAGSSSVIANPELEGDEDALTSIEIDETKYKVEDIYPTDMNFVVPKATIYTTQFGNPETTDMYGTTAVGTFWLTNVEPKMIGKKLKSITIRTQNSNRILSIMGSQVEAGDPNANRNDLSTLAGTINSSGTTKAICKLTTVAGVHTYMLDGTDSNVEIVTQDYVNACPNSVGITQRSDTEAFYYNTGMPANGYNYYWQGTGNNVTERIGVIFGYEDFDENNPELIMDLNNNTSISCSVHLSGATTSNQWKNAKMNFMGDSITEGYPTDKVTKPYWQVLRDKLNGSANGYGIGGSTIANGSQPMYSRVLNMDTNADVIFIFGGTNDFALYNRTLGDQFTISNNTKTLNTDTSTFYGGLNQLCLNLLSTFPNANYIFLTPLHRNNYDSQPTELQANGNGLYFSQYVECIRNVAEWFSIPIIDLYKESGLYPLDGTQRSKYFASSSDGLHPNQEGHNLIADCIYEKLKNIQRR